MSQTVTILTVADLHRGHKLYQELEDAVAMHRPDVVVMLGDFLDNTGDEAGRLTPEECAQVLSHLPCAEVVFIRGNHEDIAILAFAYAWTALGRDFHLLEGRTFVRGPLALVGFPCLTQQPEGLFHELPLDTDRWLTHRLRKIGVAGRTLWLMHEPPAGTNLSQAVGPMAGHQEWTAAIERFLPWLAIFGHDHITPIESGQWHHSLPGGTLCVNVGQAESGPLRYCIVTARFAGQQPSLPVEMTVTACPQGEAIRLPPVG
ncbi:MAG: metallophosphoesterase [Verrucomicrobia bacterium]|nr:metallophosphoesterase [Verrucomicrobiota bacterium]